MKTTFVTIILLVAGLAQAQISAKFCGANTTMPDFCNRMKHLRSTVNAMDSQTEMMQINYGLMFNLATSLKNNSEALLTLVPTDLKTHREGLMEINTLAKEIRVKASQNDPDAMLAANNLRNQCMQCHSSRNPTPGVPWNDMFGFSWDNISRLCTQSGQNPYLCKSMYSMETQFSHMLSAYIAKVENYDVTASVAGEIVRILKDLKIKNFVHLGEANRAEAEFNAQEVVDLAAAKNPLVFEKARTLNKTCMNCHNSAPASSRALFEGTGLSTAFHN